jgi:PPOX class probable F420-dependent enzyme
MEAAEARARFAAARVARLATADARGAPHLVPVCFALEDDTVYTAVDRKPKRTARLKRLANVEANPRAALLADHYEDGDWGRLWWVRADGVAGVLDPAGAEGARALELLAGRYAQYRADPPDGPVLIVRVERWSGWTGRSA